MPAPVRTAAYFRPATLLVLTGCAVGLAGLAGWYRYGPGRTIEPPAVPGIESDPGLRKAVEEARTAIQKNPESAGPWGHLGMLLMAHSVDVQAKTCLQEAIKLDPKDGRWPYFYGLLLVRTD